MHALKGAAPGRRCVRPPAHPPHGTLRRAEIVWREERWLLAMPLAPVAISAVERIAAHLGTLRSEWLADYRLLREEMRYEDAAGTHRRCDMVLQHLPAGRTFDEALDTEPCDTLLRSARRPGGGAATPRPLAPPTSRRRTCAGTAAASIPIRYHYARTGFGADAEALGALRDLVRRRARRGRAAPVHDTEAAYSSGERFAGHIWTGNAFEQLVCVEDEAGYGYVDLQNRPVIPAQYLLGRRLPRRARRRHAARRTHGSDRQDGALRIEPRYEIVEYDPDTNRTLVRHEVCGRNSTTKATARATSPRGAEIPETEK